MASLKSLLNCIDVDTNDNISVLRHVFGYAQNKVPSDPVSSAQESLIGFMRDVQGDHIHINVISVGNDLFSNAELNRLDYAIYRTRKIFRTINLGLGRVELYFISSADANGREDLGSEDEATELTQEWTVDNDGIDVFVVDNISDSNFVGISAVDGSCDKDSKGLNGVIGGEINRGDDFFARTFAHEIGHYLGLSHNHGARPDCPSGTNNCNNLMAQTRCAASCGGGERVAVLLTNVQGNTMRNHCFVKNGC